MNHFKRSVFTKNFTLFLLTGPLFIYIGKSYVHGTSSFDYDQLKSFISSHSYYHLLLFLNVYLVFWVKKSSKIFLPIFFIWTLILGLEQFLVNFDKLILVLNFMYLGLCFIFHTFWRSELQDAVYNPLFTPQDIEKRSCYGLNAQFVDEKGKEYLGSVTNWDKEGCFINILNLPQACRGEVDLKIEVNGLKFREKGLIVTSYDQGVGIKFSLDKDDNDEYNWKEFFELIYDRGYTPLIS